MATDLLPGAIAPSLVHVLLAVVKLAETQPTVQIPDVCRECGISAKSVVHYRLEALRDLGLVTWEPGRAGTLRPMVARVVATGV